MSKEQANASLIHFAKDLFKLWDQNQLGRIRLGTLVTKFIALGLAPTEFLALSFFNSVLPEDEHLDLRENKEAIKGKEIRLKEFVNLFKGQVYNDKILKVLNSEIRA